jgi:DNA-binding NtrC family response regulator
VDNFENEQNRESNDSIHILLAVESGATRDSLAKCFHDAGYLVDTKSTAFDTAETLATGRYDICVVDARIAEQGDSPIATRTAESPTQILVVCDSGVASQPKTTSANVQYTHVEGGHADLLQQAQRMAELAKLRRENASLRDALARLPFQTKGELLDLESLNRRYVEATLDRVNGNKAEAARRLGIHRRSLYRLLEKYNHKAVTV